MLCKHEYIYVYTCGHPTKYAWESTCPWAGGANPVSKSEWQRTWLSYVYIYIQHTHDNIYIYAHFSYI